jgi:hypothetical protein
MNALAQTQGTIYYSDDELLRALGADDQELVELEEQTQRADANI